MSGKWPLTVPEREALLLQPLVGVFSTLAPAGWIHSVPVHFLFRDGELWVLAERDSEKCRNVRRTGRGTLCVETATPLERRYVSVEGEVRNQKAHRRRRGSRGGGPVSYDKNAYRGRNVIERAFNGFKHWRGLATRYDKHAVIYRGGLVLAAALIWLADALDDVRAGLAEEGEELLVQRQRERTAPFLSTLIIKRTGGLAARPGSCRRIVG